MANLSVKLNVLPGITKIIDITLDDLLRSFNDSWSLEDRIELAMGLDLGAETKEHKLRPVAAILNSLNIQDLTVSQLLTLESVLNETISSIEQVKKEIVKKNNE